MDIESLRLHLLTYKGATESLPFGPETLVFKVMNKMFALMPIDGQRFSINLKCDPDRAIQLRETYEGIIPGYHMSKVHWNTVQLDADVSDTLLLELIDHSYDLIVNSLPKKDQAVLSNL